MSSGVEASVEMCAMEREGERGASCVRAVSIFVARSHSPSSMPSLCIQFFFKTSLFFCFLSTITFFSCYFKIPLQSEQEEVEKEEESKTHTNERAGPLPASYII